MAVIETKYSVGDVVFLASTSIERKQHPCPDCNGSRRWKALSPAGGEYSFTCPRCSGSYRANSDMSLDYSSSVPAVRRLTIGSVRHDSAERDGRSPTTYMCLETGVGSGSIYDESKLFSTEEAAFESAKLQAAEANKTTDWIAKQYDKSLDISDYQIESAALKLAADAKSRAGSMLWNLSELFDKIGEAEGKDEILEAVEDYKRFDWESDKKAAEADA
jgi:hypothetical protein